MATGGIFHRCRPRRPPPLSDAIAVSENPDRPVPASRTFDHRGQFRGVLKYLALLPASPRSITGPRIRIWRACSFQWNVRAASGSADSGSPSRLAVLIAKWTRAWSTLLRIKTRAGPGRRRPKPPSRRSGWECIRSTPRHCRVARACRKDLPQTPDCAFLAYIL